MTSACDPASVDLNSIFIMKVSESFADPGIDRDEWDSFAARQDAEIYQSYEWSRLWWEFYGRDRALRVVTFHRGDRLVALLPFFIETVGFGPFRVRIAKQVSSDFTMGTLRPLIEPGFIEPIHKELVRFFLETEGCDGLRWGPIAGKETIQRLIAAAETGEHSLDTTCHRIPHGVESVLELPATFEEYLSGISKNHRTNYRRTRNRLKREKDYESVTVQSASESIHLFEEFRSLHNRQWESVGEPGHFGDWPSALEFHRDLVQTLSPRGQLLLVCGLAEGEVVSAQYGYGFGERLTWLLPARRIEDDWSKYGLGRVGFVDMVEAAITEGYRKIHLGGAYWGYKSDLGGKEENAESILVSMSGKSARKVKRLLLLMRIYGILYYKIWFKRVAPKLPWKRHPQWQSWIRWRL